MQRVGDPLRVLVTRRDPTAAVRVPSRPGTRRHEEARPWPDGGSFTRSGGPGQKVLPRYRECWPSVLPGHDLFEVCGDLNEQVFPPDRGDDLHANRQSVPAVPERQADGGLTGDVEHRGERPVVAQATQPAGQGVERPAGNRSVTRGFVTYRQATPPRQFPTLHSSNAPGLPDRERPTRQDPTTELRRRLERCYGGVGTGWALSAPRTLSSTTWPCRSTMRVNSCCA